MGSKTTHWCDKCGRAIGDQQDFWSLSFDLGQERGDARLRKAIIICWPCKDDLLPRLDLLFSAPHREQAEDAT